MSPEERLNRAREEERLRRELQEAQEALQLANRERESACQIEQALDAGNRDGLYAFEKAHGRYRAALEEYTSALRNLSDFLLKR